MCYFTLRVLLFVSQNCGKLVCGACSPKMLQLGFPPSGKTGQIDYVFRAADRAVCAERAGSAAILERSREPSGPSPDKRSRQSDASVAALVL